MIEILIPPRISISRDQFQFFELKLYNAYVEIMGAISYTPYFTKYFRSTKPVAAGGMLLIRTIAQRLVEIGPTWDRKILDPPQNKAELLKSAMKVLPVRSYSY